MKENLTKIIGLVLSVAIVALLVVNVICVNKLDKKVSDIENKVSAIETEMGSMNTGSNNSDILYQVENAKRDILIEIDQAKRSINSNIILWAQQR